MRMLSDEKSAVYCNRLKFVFCWKMDFPIFQRAIVVKASPKYPKQMKISIQILCEWMYCPFKLVTKVLKKSGMGWCMK